jgi:ribosomal protein S18 acetylase RimI-like enzyme
MDVAAGREPGDTTSETVTAGTAASETAASAIMLRPVAEDDLAAMLAVEHAQESAWWGEVDSDEDDVSMFVERAIAEHGSAEAGTRVAVVDGRIVGTALALGHGQTSFAVDPTVPAAREVQRRLIDWQLSVGAMRIDAPAQDEQRLADLADRGFLPRLSSFDLERVADVADLESALPAGVEFVAYRPGDDEQSVHDLIYSVWTDVEGHTFRPIDEWRAYFATGPWFDADLVVLARLDDGRLGGVAMSRTFGDIGWVMQLAVGRHARGIGLGRAVLVEAFRRLASRPGVERLGLSVEAANQKALGLYRSVGLEVSREWLHCELVHPSDET